MRKLRIAVLFGSTLLFAVVPVLAQTPANEKSCPATTAIPPFVGTGTSAFSRNQNLCLPQLAPVPTGLSPLAFIVNGVEPGGRVDSQGSIYVVSIRGVPGGVDLWRWNQILDGPPNMGAGVKGTLPFKYEGQPDNCGIFSLAAGGCANNTGSTTNPG